MLIMECFAMWPFPHPYDTYLWLDLWKRKKDDDDDDDDEKPVGVQRLENEFYDKCSWKRLGRIHILHLL